jgi:hypothetical protein
MVTLDWETDRTDGVTLVRLYVTAEDRRRVRVENRLDGPVWPPREEGQPAAGWDDDAFEGVVTPDHRLVAGYATPAPPTEPPAEVVADDPADAGAPPGPVGAEAVEADARGDRATATDGGSGGTEAGTRAETGMETLGQRDNGDAPANGPTGASDGEEPTPETVVRSLGDPVVPREAVPVPDAPADEASGDREGGSPGGPEAESAAPSPGGSEPERGETDAARGEESVGVGDGGGGGDRDGDRNGGKDGDGEGGRDEDETAVEESTAEEDGEIPEHSGFPPEGPAQPQTDAELVVPGAVRAWLRDVDRRLAAVERRQAAEATDPDPTVQIAVAGDRRALASVADRVETLVGRAQALERGAGEPGDGGR